MPWTFAHPVAILPFRRLCPARLSFAALLIGSMIPDLGYYVQFATLARLAHTFRGSILVCLPTGLTLLVTLYALRRPLWFLLPQPHRAVLEPVITARFLLRPSSLVAVAASIVIGAWTHIAWDSFTHKNGWVVKQVGFLHEPAFRFGTTVFPTYEILQHLSTLTGVASLITVYCLWLRRSTRPELLQYRRTEEVCRFVLLGALAMIGSIIAITAAGQEAATIHGYLAMRVFLVRAVVYGTAAFIPLFILGSVLFYALRPEATFLKNRVNSNRKHRHSFTP